MSEQQTTTRRGLNDKVGLSLAALFFLPLILLSLPVIIVLLTAYVLIGLLLSIAIWCFWCLRGRYVLLVYSDSPNWQAYVESNVIPRLGKRAVVLNWSQRTRWRRTLAVLAFRYFGGEREFNPMAIVFCPLRKARYFRFYLPFRDFKHGHPEALAKMEMDLFDLVDTISGERAASPTAAPED